MDYEESVADISKRFGGLNKTNIDIAATYQTVCEKEFTPADLLSLNEALSVAYPSQIKRAITFFSEKHGDKINSFSYFLLPIRRGMFGTRAKAGKGGRNEEHILRDSGKSRMEEYERLFGDKKN